MPKYTTTSSQIEVVYNRVDHISASSHKFAYLGSEDAAAVEVVALLLLAMTVEVVFRSERSHLMRQLCHTLNL